MEKEVYYVTDKIYIDYQSPKFAPTGYKLNVNEPALNKLYRRYRAKKGLPLNMPLTDKERFEFERYILHKIDDGTIVLQNV